MKKNNEITKKCYIIYLINNIINNNNFILTQMNKIENCFAIIKKNILLIE